MRQGQDVPADAQTMGEIAMRGNNLMLGYYQDAAATRKACPDGWFRTGDLGVMHPDFYIELRDRAKDIIISGGENISSVEIEQALADASGRARGRGRGRQGREVGRGSGGVRRAAREREQRPAPS